MQTINSIKEMQTFSNREMGEGKTIALVPTMGFFHPGHLSLMEEGGRRGDFLVVSIFVNPTQFGAGEDYENYPRNMERDQKLAEETGVDVIFAPPVDEMYPSDYQTCVNVEEVTRNLCGISRPAHFRGVTTVVCKLFSIVKPSFAIFGEKDFQQLVAIRQMVSDLNIDVKIVGMPIYREEDGLALSSRNKYLTPDERKAALCLFRSLMRAKELFRQGERKTEEILSEVMSIIKAEQLAEIDYVKICDVKTLKDIEQINQETVLALAAKIGKTRLIDNIILNPSDCI
ncbi:MAG: pantoate--beta-alanine ligase [Deltaproteobacteria bacterium]|nr:pantoate--beta-alanine ligase [Deltaproteobacteria bacterium]